MLDGVSVYVNEHPKKVGLVADNSAAEIFHKHGAAAVIFFIIGLAIGVEEIRELLAVISFLFIRLQTFN